MKHEIYYNIYTKIKSRKAFAMVMSRRQILKLLGTAAVAAPWVSTPLFAAEPKKASHIVVAGSNSACLINIQTGELVHVPIGFMAHSFIQNLRDPMRFLAVGKWETRYAEVDFSTRGIVKAAQSAENFYSTGHGVYSARTGSYFITRSDLSTGLGHIVGLEPGSLNVAADYQISPGGLHDCQMLPDGTVLVASTGVLDKKPESDHARAAKQKVANGGLLQVDLASGRLLNTMQTADGDLAIGHFKLSSRGSILALGGTGDPRFKKDPYGHLAYSPSLGAPLRAVAMNETVVPKKLFGEILSVAMNADGSTAVVTHPPTKTLLVVDMKDGSVARQLVNPAADLGVSESGNSIAYDPALDEFMLAGNKMIAMSADFKTQREIALHTDFGADESRVLNGSHSQLVQI